MNRIELKLSLRTYLRDMYSAHNTIDEAFETGKRVQLFHDQEQISQLFPQPLEDKGLEKALLTENEVANVTSVRFSDEAWEDVLKALKTQQDKDFALLQPKIEEARRELINHIEKNCKGYEDRTVGVLLGSTFWQALKKGESE